uniref:Uncharacterized protein n=1 Tax=Lynx canadensis TaxID=61383 RepID=A0A667GNE1_LYNCA
MISSTEKLPIQMSPGHLRQHIASLNVKVSDNAFPPKQTSPAGLGGRGDLAIQKHVNKKPL